ncbi:MAG: DUF1858 domain-containing protein [Eubacterium sp.]|nr:DUF1858 domain-containing protein [Eubacterium sp.]MCR5293431.1 DUF1858 domain-containing protein [Eubacterium sp.]
MEENTKTYTAEEIDAIDGSLPIYQLLEMDPGNAAILMASGMACITCPAAYMESIEEACVVHGMDPEQVLDDVKYYMKKKYLEEDAADEID